MTTEQKIELEYVEGSEFFRTFDGLWFHDIRTNFWYVFEDKYWRLRRRNFGNNGDFESFYERLSYENAQLKLPNGFPMIAIRNDRLEKKILGDFRLQNELEIDDQKFEAPDGLPTGYLWDGDEDSRRRSYSHQVKDAGYPSGLVLFLEGKSDLGEVLHEKRYSCVVEPRGEVDGIDIIRNSFSDKNEAQKWVVQMLNELLK
jgi:hypothetical protein